MAPKRQASSAVAQKAATSEDDSKPMSSTQLKKLAREAHTRRQKQRGALLKSPAIRVAIGILSVFALFIIVRPYFKSTADSQSMPVKAAFKKEPVIINNKANPGQIYQVVDLPGKGKGMIAARDIKVGGWQCRKKDFQADMALKRGERILTDTPLMRLPKSTDENPSEWIRNQIKNFTVQDTKTFMSLSYAPPNVPEKDIPLAIIQTNAFSAGDGMAVFPNAARLNHGCSSAFNAVYSWREQEGKLYVHALRDIRQGEELLTTYTDTKRPRDERRAFLSSQYHFECNCAVCSLPDALSKASDARLRSIQHLFQRLATWNEEGITGVEAIKIINQMWAIGEEEGYTSERGQLAADAALVATAHADFESAKAWRLISAQWFLYELGTDSEEVWLNLKWGSKPDDHPAWGIKGELKVGMPSQLAAKEVTREDEDVKTKDEL